MKMVRAIVRPENVDSVTDGLAAAGFYSLTKLNVFGRGKQNGIKIGSIHYDELPKVMILMAVEDTNVDEVIDVIKSNAYTGNFGDGKIFVSPVEKVVTVRTGDSGL